VIRAIGRVTAVGVRGDTVWGGPIDGGFGVPPGSDFAAGSA